MSESIAMSAGGAQTNDTSVTGERVMLRQWRSGDSPAVFDACQDPEIQRWTAVPVPYTRSDAEWFVDEMGPQQWSTGEGAPFALVDVHDQQLIASMGVHWFRDGTAEVGYWTVPDMRGRGYTAEGLRLLAEWTFDQRSVVRVQLTTHVGNKASREVALRAGFTEEGTLRSALLHRGEHFDAVMYSLLASDL